MLAVNVTKNLIERPKEIGYWLYSSSVKMSRWNRINQQILPFSPVDNKPFYTTMRENRGQLCKFFNAFVENS